MPDQADNIFEATETKTEAATTEVVKPQESTVDPYADMLKGITTEDGRQKYSDVETALKSLAPANEHIRKLESELASLRSDLDARKSVEDALSDFTKSTGEETTSATPQEVDYSKITEIVNSTLETKAAQDKALGNTQKVAKAMSEKFGDKAEEMFYAKADEIGMSRQEINRLASVSPQAAIKLVTGETPSTPGSLTSSVNTELLGETPKEKPSAKISMYADTKEMVRGWEATKPT